jgi:hypothetical protein
MNKMIILILLLSFAAVLFYITYAFKSQRLKKYYENIDDRNLVEQNVQAKFLGRRILIIQYAVVIPLFGLGAAMPRLQVLFLPAIIIYLCAILLRKFCDGLELATTTELEYRKFKKDKTDSQQPLPHVPSTSGAR